MGQFAFGFVLLGGATICVRRRSRCRHLARDWQSAFTVSIDIDIDIDIENRISPVSGCTEVR
jgi:hypothetical protein